MKENPDLYEKVKLEKNKLVQIVQTSKQMIFELKD
jgi:hypothetical protein